MRLKYPNGIVRDVLPLVGKELVAAGIAEECPREPSTPVSIAPEWSVAVIGTLTKEAAIILRIGQSTYRYTGHPDNVNAKHYWVDDGVEHWRWFSGLGRECPEEICAAYRKLWFENPEYRRPGISGVARGMSAQEDQFRGAGMARTPDGALVHALPSNEAQSAALSRKRK